LNGVFVARLSYHNGLKLGKVDEGEYENVTLDAMLSGVAPMLS
jgi:hypothetical protein